jgi:spore coat protein A, manganese oxidase
MLNRRDLIRLGVLAGAGAVLPIERLAGTRSARAAAGPAVPVFGVPLSVPPVLRPRFSIGRLDYFEMTTKQARVEILPGTTTPVFGYDGHFPGPTVKTRRGRLAVVRQRNELPEQVAVHLHGGNVPSSSDGIPGDEIRPGGSRTYYYPNRQQAATLWYHDHVHHHEARHTYFGLSGLYLITDPAEDWLRLPAGRYDVPLVIQDRLFNPDGSFRMPGEGEFFGDTMLVNGRPSPYFEVEQRSYRFRLLNASSLDAIHDLTLDNGATLHVIGTDGGLLPAPVALQRLMLAPSERYDVVIDFSDVELGEQVVLNSKVLGTLDAALLRFDVTKRARGNDRLPEMLVPVRRLSESTATVRREFVLSTDPVARKMLINGKEFDPERIDIRPKLGSTEIWTVVNGEPASLPVPHVFHTHLVRFQILDRNGSPPPAHESGWKDSVTVMPGQKVRLIMKFGDFPGRFLYHCHLMLHADIGMMAQMEVVP